MSSNTRCSGLSRQRGYSTSRMASAFLDLNPIEMCGILWEASCWSKLSSDKQEHLILALTEERDKLPQQLLIMLCKVWYDVWNVASHSTVDISRVATIFYPTRPHASLNVMPYGTCDPSLAIVQQ
ncbi:hypothetical protein TNCV_1182681 [Trichonephila clavipes]|nr:hypothetical protein TNCV_1182681 [Trichonephila clavipes]